MKIEFDALIHMLLLLSLSLSHSLSLSFSLSYEHERAKCLQKAYGVTKGWPSVDPG